MRFHSLSGSPFVPSSKTFSDSRLLLVDASEGADEHSEQGEGDLDSWNFSIGSTNSETSISSEVSRTSGHGVMASISSIVVDRLDFLEAVDILLGGLLKIRC